jgi:hypothetical protein
VGHHQHLFVGEFTQKPRRKQRTYLVGLPVPGWNGHCDAIFVSVGDVGQQFCELFVVGRNDVRWIHVLAEG